MATTESKTFYPTEYWEENALTGTISNLSNAIGKGSSNTVYAIIYPYAANSDSFIRWQFDLSAIPENATIDSVACSYKARCKLASTTYMTSANAYLATYNTTKTGGSNFLSTAANVRNISGATWTRSELNGLNLLLLWNAKASNNNGSIYFYGADLTITYTYQSEKFMLKLGGAWHDIARVFKKVNGIWVEQTELASVIEDGVRYKNGGEYVKPVITFTIWGTSYQAEGGMTWAEWVASSYNTVGYEVYGGYIMKRGTMVNQFVGISSSTRVLSSDKIVADMVYTIIYN